jgi:hypothetical protein
MRDPRDLLGDAGEDVARSHSPGDECGDAAQRRLLVEELLEESLLFGEHLDRARDLAHLTRALLT